MKTTVNNVDSLHLLKTLLSGKQRKVFYFTYVILLLIMGTVEVAVFGTIQEHNPEFLIPLWFEIASNIITYLGIPVSTLAIANIDNPAVPSGTGHLERQTNTQLQELTERDIEVIKASLKELEKEKNKNEINFTYNKGRYAKGEDDGT